MNWNGFIIYRESERCSLWIEKVKAKDKIYIWGCVRWKNKNLENFPGQIIVLRLLWCSWNIYGKMVKPELLRSREFVFFLGACISHIDDNSRSAACWSGVFIWSAVHCGWVVISSFRSWNPSSINPHNIYRSEDGYSVTTETALIGDLFRMLVLFFIYFFFVIYICEMHAIWFFSFFIFDSFVSSCS